MLPSKIRQYLFALFFGALMPLSFAPFNLAFIAPFSLAFLLVLIKGKAPKQSFMLGLLFGFGLFSWGIWWVRISLLEFGGAPLPVGIFLTLLLALYLALFYGLLTYLMSRIRGSVYLKVGIFFPVIGVLLEFLRGELFTGFPWLALGYSLTDSPIAHILFPEMGAMMSSFWVYWLAGVLFVVFTINFGKKSVVNKGSTDVIGNGETHGVKTSLRKFLPNMISLVVMGGVICQ